MNKTFTWTNKFFKVEFYSLGILRTQLAIFIGLAATWLFATQNSVKKLCVVFLLLDIIANIIVLITSSEFSYDEVARKSKPEKMDVKVEHKKSKTVESKEKKPRKGSETINNKVPIPNSQPKEEVVPQEKPKLKQASVVPDAVQPKSVATMSDDDWDKLWDVNGGS